MKNLLVSLFGSAAALWVAARIVPGVALSQDFAQVLLVAVIFGLVNAFVKPVIKLLALPLIFLTFGLVSLVINAGMLLLTDRLATGLMVADFASAFLGALVISVINLILGSGGGGDD